MTARVFHADLWGRREQKYAWLLDQDVSTTAWAELDPGAPFHLFKPQDVRLRAEYDAGWRVTDVFPVNSVGIVTARDHLCIQWSPDEMWTVVRDFPRLSEAEARERFQLGADVQDWRVADAQTDVRSSGPRRELVVPVLYRPFDLRFTYYTGRSRGLICRPRAEVMRHMLAGPNLSLISARSNKSSEMDHFFISRLIMETKCGERTTQSCQFPLYVCPETSPGAGRPPQLPNLNPGFVGALGNNLGLAFVTNAGGDLEATFGPEDVLHYIYAVLHSPTYRQRYAEFLRIDFPRIPLTANRRLFRELCGLGGELVALHLLESPRVNTPITRYPVAGDHRVEAGHPKYLAPGEPEPGTGRRLESGRVYISKENRRQNRQGQFFEGVPPEVWEFHIGGYQVCEKWLKDRRNRNLSFDELTRYQQIIVALRETVRLMAEIDRAIESHGGWPVR
jgi:hypothetical protein